MPFRHPVTRPCHKCGVMTITKSPQVSCLPCRKAAAEAYKKQWHAENPGYMKTYHKQWYAEHRERELQIATANRRRRANKQRCSKLAEELSAFNKSLIGVIP